MTGFSITFRKKSNDGPISLTAHGEGIGEIRLGDFVEAFNANLSSWDADTYRRYWNESLTRLLTGADRCGLLMSVFDPKTANFFRWWTAYRNGDQVVFHKEILFLERLVQEFRIENIHEFIRPYTNLTEDGAPVSEWRVRLADISDFVARMSVS